MSNDYEYLGDSQMAPPMAPRPPTNAPAELITGPVLPHTPALKANDDVDLESNRPQGNNNISFSDNYVGAPKTNRSTKSDEETKSDEKAQVEGEKRKTHKCGTCWYIFAGVTICLAVVSLLALGAFLLMNSDSSEPIMAALGGINETTTPVFSRSSFNLSSTTPLPPSIVNTGISTVSLKTFEQSTTNDHPGSSTSSVVSSDNSTETLTSEISREITSSAEDIKTSSLIRTSTESVLSISTSSLPEELKDTLPEDKMTTKTTAADNSIENAVGDEPNLSVHSLNRAICVLIAKVDRFYSQVCRELCLPALHDLCVAIVSSSENRVFYSAQKHIHLTAPVSLLSRISDIISTLSHRPLIHQMFIYPLVSAHFVKVCQCDQESRIAASALAEVVTRLLITESPGMSFNQTLIVPFQTASCSENCSEETKEQLLSSLSQLVLSQADKIGSGWKPLFGSLKAVGAARDEKVHWCAIDVISSYLRIDSPPILSSSILECVPCVVNLLQNSDDSSEVSSAALRLLPNIYSLILYLYSTPHVPNYHLLHRSDLRSKCLDTVEMDQDPLSVVHGPFPWEEKQTYEIAAVELFLTFMDQICGTLLTSSPTTQKNLLDMIGRLLVDIHSKPLGADSGGICMSSVILPYVQKWIRRPDVEEVKILKQVIGACTQTVIDMLELEKMISWRDRLLRDICALIVECILFDKTCAVAPAYFTLIAKNSSQFSTQQWTIFSHFLAKASSQSLRHIRLINSFFVRSSKDENGDIGDVTSYNPGKLSFRQILAAIQVFSSKQEKSKEEEEDLSSGVALIMLSHGADTHRLEVHSIISSVFTHCLLLQLIASLLLSDDLNPKLKASLTGTTISIDPKLDDSIYVILYNILNESSEQYHLIPVENGDENAYRLVSQEFVDDTLNEYDKHRDRLKPFVPDRRNPFQHAIEDIDPIPIRNSDQKKEDFDEIRLAAHRDICVIPLRYVVDNLLREHLSDFLPAITQIVLSSPDLAIRQLAVDFMTRLA
uniref:DUF1981 domain-containing protein n=1 Tax=Caenorhabditis tropicalis TaxID=1561998 RepID=A0A1I7T8H5_9PELO